MKQCYVSRAAWIIKVSLISILVVVASVNTLYAQSPTTTDADAMQRRLARARALAAAHNLGAAAAELDAIRTSTTDEMIRDITRIMLMGIYLEQADYTRAQTLLEETYTARATEKESTVRAYFTLAGQSINGAREHIERYRVFGINVASKELPPEAVNDLDRLRLFLERIADQAREIGGLDARSMDAVALLEGVASVRLTLARNSEERQQWQRETNDARQKLSGSETSIASLRGGAPRRPPAPTSNTIPVGGVGANSSAVNTTATTGSTPDKTTTNSSNTTPQPPKQSVTPPAKPQSVKKSGTLISVGSLLERAKQKVSPSYPAIARNARITGVVRVYVEIDENGTVTKVQRTDGPEMLRGAAESAARLWKFTPLLVDGQPVRFTGFVSFSFTLHN